MIDYREAGTKDFNRIAQLSAKSFGHYPYFDCAFRNAFKNEESYNTYMEKLHRVNIKANAQQNKCFVGVKDGEIVSAALIQDPAKKKADVEDYVKVGGLSLVYPVGLSKILDFFHFSEDAGLPHSLCSKAGRTGTDPHHQHRGQPQILCKKWIPGVFSAYLGEERSKSWKLELLYGYSKATEYSLSHIDLLKWIGKRDGCA